MIGIIISIIMLGLSFVGGFPYGYYQLLRLVVCITSIFVVVKMNQLEKENWMWIFVILAVIFNPLIPLHLGKELWLIVDAIAIILFVIIMPVLKPNLKKIFKIIGISIGSIIVLFFIVAGITEFCRSKRAQYYAKYDPLEIGDYKEFKNGVDYLTFAKKLRMKFPEYKDYDNTYLVEQLIEKYPAYTNVVVFQGEETEWEQRIFNIK